MRRNRSLSVLSLSLSLSLSLLLAVLTLFSFASCNNNPEGYAGSLTISVSDAVPKLIAYNPADNGLSSMSHYGISLKDSDGSEIQATETPMALYGGSGSFTIRDLVSGTYTVDATGYIQRGGEYVPIATGSTGAFQLSPSSNTSKTILINEFLDEPAESISIDIILPQDAAGPDSTYKGTLAWSVAAIGTGEVKASGSVELSSQYPDGTYTLSVSDRLSAGRYFVTATYTASDDKTYSSVGAMLLYPGLPATGTIDLDSQQAFDSSFTVTDGIGGILNIDGNREYKSENGTVVVTLKKALGSTQSVFWYVDGVEKEPEVSGNTYTFTGLAAGKRCIVGIVVDNETTASVGAVVLKVSVAKMGIAEMKKVTIERYVDLAQNTDIPENCINTGYVKKGASVEGLEEGNIIFPYTTIVPKDVAYEDITPEIAGLIPVNIDYSRWFDFNTSDLYGNQLTLIPSRGGYNKRYIGFPDGINFISTDYVSGGIFTGNDYDIVFTDDVYIPESVSMLGKAFSETDCLKNVLKGDFIMPAGVTELYNKAFACCAGLTGDLIIPEGFESFNGGEEFLSCTGFDGILQLPESLKCINVNTFGYCSNLTGDVRIPIGVEVIGYAAFINCGVDRIFVPHSKDSLPEGWHEDWADGYEGEIIYADDYLAFSLNEDGQSYEVTGFRDDVDIPSEVKEHLVIPGTYQGLPVTRVGENAFGSVYSDKAEKGIKTIQLPDSIEVIKEGAFACLESLEGVLELPKNLKRIENSAFYRASGAREDYDSWSYKDGVEEIIFPVGLEYIGELAFAQTYSISKDTVIPGTVKEIGSGAFEAFSGDGALDYSDKKCTFVVEDGVEIIGDFFLNMCSGLGNGEIIRIPPSVTKMGTKGFTNGIMYAKALSVGWPSWQKPEGWADNWDAKLMAPVIYEDAMYSDGAFYYNRNEDGTFTIATSKEDEVSELVIPSEFNGQSVIGIGDYAFSKLKYSGEIIIPASIQSIGYRAFYGSDISGTIVIPESVTTVSEFAFEGSNENLTVIVPWAEGGKPEGWDENWLMEYGGNPKATIIYNGGETVVEHEVGDTVTIDGIESVIVYKAETEQDWGRYILMDKNHDLCWYFSSSDYADEKLPVEEAKYGYEWGGEDYDPEFGTDEGIGSGLSNTNELILLHFQPETENWSVIWDKVQEFRNLYSEKWFVPSKDELLTSLKAMNNLDNFNSIKNLSSNTAGYYWTSTRESNGAGIYCVYLRTLGTVATTGDQHGYRIRLCRYAIDAELNIL